MTMPGLPSTADLQPTLVGTRLLLRPLAADDLEPLYAVAADPLIWAVHPEPTRWQRPVFEGVFAKGLASGGALTVVDRADGRIIGSSRYYEWAPATREIAIGYTFLARSHWGGETNRELKTLMLDHVFGFARVAWFHVGAGNWRSRRAMEKIGGRLALETKRQLNGVEQDYVYYRIDADDWPRIRSGPGGVPDANEHGVR